MPKKLTDRKPLTGHKSREARGLRLIHITVSNEQYELIRKASRDKGIAGWAATLSRWCSAVLERAARKEIREAKNEPDLQ